MFFFEENGVANIGFFLTTMKYCNKNYFCSLILNFIMEFTQKLLNWYHRNKRDLPWRHTLDPYHIWLSEIILQQTRIDQGTPYYHRFLSVFPGVHDLANASEQDVLKLWQGLGYYSRARNLHVTAKEIVRKYKRKFPDSYEDLIKLKGIGAYTAAAIASIAFHKPVPLVDGNVLRFLSRYFGIEDPVDSGKGKSEVLKKAQRLMDPRDPGSFNQALMEFGARKCIPLNPECKSCIFKKECVAFILGMVDRLPHKAGKKSQRERFFHFLVIHIRGKEGFYLYKREENDIWRNLYTFPLIETGKLCSLEELKAGDTWKEIFTDHQADHIKQSGTFRHILTHQIIQARFYEMETEKPFNRKWIFVCNSEIEKFPLPKLVEKYLK